MENILSRIEIVIIATMYYIKSFSKENIWLS